MPFIPACSLTTTGPDSDSDYARMAVILQGCVGNESHDDDMEVF